MDPGLLEQALEDKAYMAQLIEIQHMRGVKEGDIFYKLLKQGSPAKGKYEYRHFAKKAGNIKTFFFSLPVPLTEKFKLGHICWSIDAWYAWSA